MILRYGRYVFVPEKKWLLAEQWINHFSIAGIFFARLLPVVRQSERGHAHSPLPSPGLLRRT